MLAPTRELASQIAESFRAYGRHTGLTVALVFGGVPKPRQTRQLAAGVDVLVATPGRLLDHLNDRAVRLDAVEVLVLDEADHMLDLGFIIPIRSIAALVPAKRQTLLFTATMPPEIAKLADGLLRDPVHVAVAPVAATAERVTPARRVRRYRGQARRRCAACWQESRAAPWCSPAPSTAPTGW